MLPTAGTRDWLTPAAVFVGLLAIYMATLAPGVTLWDSGEFLAAIHSLGIPHPPGTPLYVLLGHVWVRVLGPFMDFAYSVNLLSAVATAGACAVLGHLFSQWTGDRLAAFAAAMLAGLGSSVWLSATETEVYAPALFMCALILWTGAKAGATGAARWMLLGAYLAGLAWALHLSALLAVPAAAYLALSGRRRRINASLIPVAAILALLGASCVLFMLVRAQHDPAINQGNPSTWGALYDVIARKQYRPAGLWPRQAPWFLQIGNVFQYADWQFALGVDGGAAPSLRRTPVSVAYAILGVIGMLLHRAQHRRSWRALLILLVTGTIGVAAYLNLKAGPSFGFGVLPDGALREARERDYFFALGFVCWGLWAGFGAVRLGTIAGSRWSSAAAPRVIAGALALLPLALNWRATDRSQEPEAATARNLGMEILASSPANAVVLTRGDNDTYPAWYLQQVEGIRRDVTVVPVPMLGADWLRAELRRRHGLLDPEAVQRWRGTGATLENLAVRAESMNRVVLEAR